jgi:hypothetical protein
MTRRAAAALLLVAGCLPDTPRDRFDRNVVPVFERHCLSTTCHGVAPGAVSSGEVLGDGYFFVDLDERGVVADLDTAYATTRARINTGEPPEVSTLLRKPLAVAAGGEVHKGGAQFRDQTHPDYLTLRDWIASEDGGGETLEPDDLTALERQFAAEVQPELAALQCMNAGCHGASAPFTSFAPPVVIDGQAYLSLAATRRNYGAARPHLARGGPGDRSRLLRKGLPLWAGGIAHRGGNDIFFRPGDRAALAIERWAAAEREAALGGEPQPSGLVFVRGPAAPERAFDRGGFVPSTDLFVLEPPEPGGAARNLTATAHPDGPAAVRDPAVRHDGAVIAFAMRTSADDAFNVYEIGVDGTGLRQLTHDRAALPGGGEASNVEPTYGPDGRIYFSSTRAGHLADGGDRVDSEIWAVDPDTGALERITYSPSPEVSPSFIGVGKSYGTLAFTMRRTIGGRFEAPVLRMPLDHNKRYHGDPEIHIHHGVTLAGDILYALRTLPDGRFSCVLLHRDNRWRAGRLAVFDRQLGPELPVGAEPAASVGGFRHAFAAVDPAAASGGVSAGGGYRHPVPLPDGRLIATWARGPVDLDAADVTPELGLYRITLDDDAGGVSLAARELVLDEPGVAEYDAEPIVRRPLEDDPGHEPAWDPTRSELSGVLALRHVETLEAVFANLEQRGVKPLRTDLVYARLVEAVLEPAQAGAAAPGGGQASRILAELRLAGGSVYARVPSDRPFRLQLLDADRLAVGAQHNRWLHVAPGETFPGGVDPALYPALCSGCHGGLSGDRADTGGPVPDAVTAASMTLATHRDLDPRRPLPPTPIGAPLTIDYRASIAPLVARSCAAACHGGDAPAGGLDLSARPAPRFDTAYLALQAHLEPGSARQSPLAERVLGRELDAPAPLTGRCPGEPVLTAEERLALTRWIDLGATYRGGGP